MGIRSLDRSFAAGEITPELYGRIDLNSYQTGVAMCRNFITLPHGPAANRPGTEYVNEVKTSSKRTRLIPFSYSTTQTMVLEFGDGYLRFHTNGGTLLLSGVPYEIGSPYAEANLFDIHYVQSADVMTLVHPLYPPYELRRNGATNWTLQPISFGTNQTYFGGLVIATAVATLPARPPAPAFVHVSSSAGAGPDSRNYIVTALIDDARVEGVGEFGSIVNIQGTQPLNITWGAVGGAIGYRVYREVSGQYYRIAETTLLAFDDNQTEPNLDMPLQGFPPTPNYLEYKYVLTAVSAEGQESVASSVATAFSDLTYPGSMIVVAPTLAAAGIPYDHYNVYKESNGSYGYIGSALKGIPFSDNNIDPDMTRQPPLNQNPFPSGGNWPQAVSYFEQRRLFAGTINFPQTLWGSRTGTESNFNTNIVVRDDDAISFRIAAREANTIRHIVPLGEAILLTSSAVWRVTSSDGGALTPSTLSVRVQSYTGANGVQPVVTDSSILYAQARGGHIREIVYTRADNGAVGYGNTDMSLLAPHLFNFKTIVDLAFAKAPYPILWAVSSDGRLLGMTYVPEQKVAGWHRHDTDGFFESCTVVTEGEEDMLYVIVRRLINGTYKRYVERLHTRQFQQLQDAFFVDCGDTYSGAPATVISGLGHLEGKKVVVLGDGAVFAPRTVVGGSITLEQAVSLAHVGLPITADLVTLPMSTEQITAAGQGRPKNVNNVYLRVSESSGITAGPWGGKLVEYKQRTTEPYGSPPRIIGSEEIKIPLEPKWQTNGQVQIRQSGPLPLTVVSMALDTAVGG
jgi:hypothetical protein